jgi:hypothetical protein
VHIIPLVAMTAFFVLAIVGTVGKLLFDDWRARQALRLAIAPLPAKPQSASGE